MFFSHYLLIFILANFQGVEAGNQLQNSSSGLTVIMLDVYGRETSFLGYGSSLTFRCRCPGNFTSLFVRPDNRVDVRNQKLIDDQRPFFSSSNFSLTINRSTLLGEYACVCQEPKKINGNYEIYRYNLSYRMCDFAETMIYFEECPINIKNRNSLCVKTMEYPNDLCQPLTTALCRYSHKNTKLNWLPCFNETLYDSLCEAYLRHPPINLHKVTSFLIENVKRAKEVCRYNRYAENPLYVFDGHIMTSCQASSDQGELEKAEYNLVWLIEPKRDVILCSNCYGLPHIKSSASFARFAPTTTKRRAERPPSPCSSIGWRHFLFNAPTPLDHGVFSVFLKSKYEESFPWIERRVIFVVIDLTFNITTIGKCGQVRHLSCSINPINYDENYFNLTFVWYRNGKIITGRKSKLRPDSSLLAVKSLGNYTCALNVAYHMGLTGPFDIIERKYSSFIIMERKCAIAIHGSITLIILIVSVIIAYFLVSKFRPRRGSTTESSGANKTTSTFCTIAPSKPSPIRKKETKSTKKKVKQ